MFIYFGLPLIIALIVATYVSRYALRKALETNSRSAQLIRVLTFLVTMLLVFVAGAWIAMMSFPITR